ncbi:hypothetical protein GFV16_11355 [Bacillus megaterium]|uniref:hypothetical protein n=1 Tax=Priestia megaterium TaxID=1404 RepID=UPI001325A423|nr:hypothetical protein [Priestia megaterium]MQR86508.1 hypothetical protein [Priestia megaterium]
MNIYIQNVRSLLYHPKMSNIQRMAQQLTAEFGGEFSDEIVSHEDLLKKLELFVNKKSSFDKAGNFLSDKEYYFLNLEGILFEDYVKKLEGKEVENDFLNYRLNQLYREYMSVQQKDIEEQIKMERKNRTAQTFFLQPSHATTCLTYQSSNKWDYVKLAKANEKPVAVIFEPDPDSNAYFLRMETSNYKDYVYFTTDSRTSYVYLNKKEKASRYYLDHFGIKNETTPSPIWDMAGGTDGNKMCFNLYEKSGEQWLTTLGYKRYEGYMEDKEIKHVIDRKLITFIRP